MEPDPTITSKEGCTCWSCYYNRLDKPYLTAIMDGDPIVLFIICQKCGNKRCPHAGDHRYLCTNSNEPDQVGVLDE